MLYVDIKTNAKYPVVLPCGNDPVRSLPNYAMPIM